jgi:hypothetical protein
VLWATRPPGKDVKREAVERDLLAALQASPIANFCKDTEVDAVEMELTKGEPAFF